MVTDDDSYSIRHWTDVPPGGGSVHRHIFHRGVDLGPIYTVKIILVDNTKMQRGCLGSGSDCPVAVVPKLVWVTDFFSSVGRYFGIKMDSWPVCPHFFGIFSNFIFCFL